VKCEYTVTARITSFFFLPPLQRSKSHGFAFFSFKVRARVNISRMKSTISFFLCSSQAWKIIGPNHARSTNQSLLPDFVARLVCVWRTCAEKLRITSVCVCVCVCKKV